jgi:hypothetical protein
MVVSKCNSSSCNINIHFLSNKFGYINNYLYLCSRKHLKKHHYFQGFLWQILYKNK